MAAKYGGYFLKGLAGGLESGFKIGQSITEMKWKKAEKAKLEKEQEMILEGESAFRKKVEEIYADGTISDEENMQLTTVYLASAYEVKERIDSTFKAIQQGQRDIAEQNLQWLKFYGESLGDLDPSSIPELFEFTRGQIKSEKGIGLFTAYDGLLKKKYEVAEAKKPEIFPTAEAARAAYPEAKIRYTTEGYVAEFGEPTAPAELSAKDNWAIDNYKAGRISFNQLSKYMGTYIAPEEMSDKEREIELAKQYGATNEEIKNKLLGVGEPTPPTAPAIENVREDILGADTVEDARRIEKNHIAKYGDTLDIPDIDKYWAEGQTIYLDKIKTAIGNIIDEKGWLKKGTLTSAEVGLEFAGDQPVEEVYKKLYEEYKKYRDMLEKMGVDLTEFPELKPLEEIEKVGLGEGFWGWGKQKGQFKSIYK